MKKCKKCGIEKVYGEFSKDKRANDGLQSSCKNCGKISSIKSYHKNKEKRSKYSKEYYKSNKDELLRYRRNWNHDNKSKICISKNEKRKNNYKYKILTNLRSRISMAIKQNSKSASTKELLGCSIDYLKLYLEDMFDDDMSWYNYGLWHIDHIQPCASFDLSDLDQQKQCFHYTNLQPLWAKDNLSKGAKYES